MKTFFLLIFMCAYGLMAEAATVETTTDVKTDTAKIEWPSCIELQDMLIFPRPRAMTPYHAWQNGAVVHVDFWGEEGELLVEIRDQSGKVVASRLVDGRGEGSVELPIEMLLPGTYRLYLKGTRECSGTFEL